ncbi:PREDICTED: putative GPI-anchored protein PB15E9.01c [Ceratosolen solmsi marchali]|uniref:GPI-anchored protein PB15E9.01c n=1 Tax=Ceratosolen solmsi marchali TaxID=326594 RepID=A0AAJ6YJN0_9HYME|nr:PREDICTED: putative GPI-anchored protein PB15E9.01c [Ceratosolen solmsi marchali]
MEDDQRIIRISLEKIQLAPIFWTYFCLLLMLSGSLSAIQDNSYGHGTEEKTANLGVTEETSLVSSSQGTSNTIPEAEESTSEILRKYGGKKVETSAQAEQVEKPYGYTRSQSPIDERETKANVTHSDILDNDIHQSKRSGVSVSSSVDTSSTESTTQSDIRPESQSESTGLLSNTTLFNSTESFTLNGDTDSTSMLDKTITSADQISHTTSQELQEKNTEIFTSQNGNSSLTRDTSTMSIASVATMPTMSTMNQSEILSTDSTNIPSTIIELTTTQQEESPITVITATTTTSTTSTTTTTGTTPTPMTPSSTTTPVTTSSTIATTEAIISTTIPTMTKEPTTASTAPLTKSTSVSTTTTPVIIMPTKSSIKTRLTTKKMTTMLRTVVTPKTISTSSENYGSLSTWPDENLENTIDVISPTLSTEDITLLIRIIFEGSWYDVCSKLPALRLSLAELINNNVEKTISQRQIIFHQTQCTDNLIPASLVSDISPLTSVLVYIVDESGHFDGTLTNILPSLYQMSPIDFPLKIHSFQLVPEADSSNAIAVIIVSCVAFICLILLAGLLFIMRKRQGRFNYGERCRPVSLDAYSLDSVSAYNSVRRNKGALRSSKRSYGNPTFEDSSAIPTRSLNFAALETFCADVTAVDEEFAGIPQVSSKIDELPPGAELKNRYANVIPLPETRVPLLRLNNDPLTEYINASYIRGPKNAGKFYIACQAPTESTVPDFWRMIWEQQCRVIIMLTDLVENGAEKCSEYIPPLEVSDCHRLYGDYQVTLRKREAKEKYAISTLHLKNLEKNTFREVWHIWYLWPANGIPADGAGLIAVLLEARALQRNATGPIVVHCSPGTGRTGTLIALDLGIRQYEMTRTVDVPRVVYTIRRDRAGAVQTQEQYAFIYKGLHLYASKLAGGTIEST